MKSAKSIGRTIGVLLFVQLVLITTGFILLLPIAAPTFLQDASGSAFQIRTAVLLLTLCGLLTIGIAVVASTVFRQHDHKVALWLLALGVIWFSMQSVDNINILSMLSLSQQYAHGGASRSDAFELLATAMRSTRRFSHCTALIAIDFWFLMLFGVVLRFSLIPRALAAFGLLMTTIHLIGVALLSFLGYASVPALGYSLALAYLSLGIWLVWKGLEERPSATD